MSFHSPHLLWLLVPLLLLFSWELARHTARASTAWPKIARAWAGAFDVSLGTRHTTAETRPRIWLWFGLACCIIALARPQWGVVEEKVFDQSREVLLALDLSRSMMSTDVKPSRLERSKLLINSLLDGLKGERVGLVLFSGTAFLQSPLSSDYEVLREFLPALKPDYLPEGGTNYKALLETSMQSFGTSAADRYLIILSDGEATEEDWKSLVEPLKAKGIRVIGLGIGTTQGSFIPDGSGGFVKDDRGAVVLSRLESSTLQELAQVTRGAYSDASAWVDLPDLLRQTVEAGKKGDFTQKNTARPLERFQWFLAPGLLLLFFSYWAEFPVRPRERALPLGRAKGQRAPAKAPAAAAASLLIVLLVMAAPSPALAAQPPKLPSVGSSGDNPAGAFAAPLSKTVERLSSQDTLSAKDCADLAQTTITYGQRTKSAQQMPPEGVIRDALAAVDVGEKSDAKIADWPRVRSELQELLKKQDEQKKQDQQKQDQQKQEKQKQQNQDQQNQDQQNQQDQNQEQKQDQQKKQQSEQQKQEQQKQQQDAFGKMKDQSDPKAEPPKQPPAKPQGGTQKVGGQKEKKQEAPLDPQMAIPLQKLQQVKDLDSPAKLQLLMQGQQQPTAQKGKNW